LENNAKEEGEDSFSVFCCFTVLRSKRKAHQAAALVTAKYISSRQLEKQLEAVISSSRFHRELVELVSCFTIKFTVHEVYFVYIGHTFLMSCACYIKERNSVKCLFFIMKIHSVTVYISRIR